jgi:hypothetical protein
MAIFWPYVYVLGAYLLYGIVRAPLVLDRIRADKIADLTTANKTLVDNSTIIVGFQFQEMIFGQRYSVALIILHAKLLNRDSPTTLHDIRLTSDSGSPISLRPSNNGFPRHAIDDIKLDAGAVETGWLEFNGSGKERDWTLEYLDNHGILHREPIPRTIHRE